MRRTGYSECRECGNAVSPGALSEELTGSLPCEQLSLAAPRPLSCSPLTRIPISCKLVLTVPPAAFSGLVPGRGNRGLQVVAVFRLCHLLLPSL